VREAILHLCAGGGQKLERKINLYFFSFARCRKEDEEDDEYEEDEKYGDENGDEDGRKEDADENEDDQQDEDVRLMKLMKM